MQARCPAVTNCNWTLAVPCPAGVLYDYNRTAMVASTDSVLALTFNHSVVHVTNEQQRCCCQPPRPAHGRLCNSTDECAQHLRAANEGACPSQLQDTWKSLPGFSEATNLAMACRPMGGWLAPGVEKYRETYFGVNRSAAFHPTQTQCSNTSWSYSRHRQVSGPPIIGTDADIASVLHHNHSLNVTVLRQRMGRPFVLMGRENGYYLAYPQRTLNGPLYTPCSNILFIMCAVHGWLRGQQGGMLYLATAGSMIGTTCDTCGACRPDLSWDACWITKQEYCTLARACENGHEVWNRTGFWRCIPKRIAVKGP